MAEHRNPNVSSLTIGKNTYPSGSVSSKIQSRIHYEESRSLNNNNASFPTYTVSRAPIVNTSLFSSGGKVAVNNVKSAFGRNADMGSQIAKGVVVTGVASYVYFKGVKNLTPKVIQNAKDFPSNMRATGKKIVKIGKGTYELYTTTNKLVVTINKSLPYLKSGFIPFKKAIRTNAAVSGLKYTSTSRKIISRISQIQNRVQTTKNTISDPTALKQKVGVIGKQTVLKAKRNIGDTTKWVAKKGVPNIAKTASNISLGVGSALARSNDETLKTAGDSIRIATYSIKTSVGTAKFAGRTIKTATKSSYRTAENAYKTIKYAQKNGLKSTTSKVKNKIKNAVSKAGKSIVSAMIDGVKSLGGKIVMPLVVGVALIALVISLFGGAAGSIAYYLSGEFLFDNGDGTYTLTDIKTFLYNNTVAYGIPIERYNEINYVENLTQYNLKSNLDFFGNPTGEFDCVEFRIEYDDFYTDVTDKETANNKIAYRFYTVDELYEVVQPIFYAALLAEHDLQPSETEARETLEEIFKVIFDHERVIATKLCYWDAHSCGLTHSMHDCPNPLNVVHTEYTCDYCCRYTCEGHKQKICGLQAQEGHICDNNCEKYDSVTFCDGCKFVCDGSDFCNGHTVAQYTWNMKDIEYFFEEYFEIPIRELEEDNDRTPEDEERLALLKDYYELSRAYFEGSN